MSLILVLSILAILSILIVSFLQSVSSESKSSQAGTQTIETRWLAETCVNLVISQIQKATTLGNTSWASQPGMIRNYDVNGQPSGYVKLYSSASMSGTSGFDPGAKPIPATWMDDTAFYTDLNSPVTNGGITYYPILDPAAVDANKSEGSISTKAVDQFFVDNTAPAVAASTGNSVPMPVQWLYVLRDGTTVTPTGSGPAAIIAGETETNPIISRIAFWTDDESCKVNINTASEGTYFDIPHADTLEERRMGRTQPLIGEFQRYPGHPALTSLSSVLESLLPTPGTDAEGKVVDYSKLEKYYSITPRIQSGGTKGGTVITEKGGTVLPNKMERLYTSLDEIYYKPDRTQNSAGIGQADLQRFRFFLTANSRAPEINLFGRPRIAIWPIHTRTDWRTQQDSLIAFCSTIGKKPYYFQRFDPESGVNDYNNIPRNKDLYKFMQDATSHNIPGFGGNFSAKYGAPERDQILTEIFDYIRCTNLNDPKLPIDKSYTWFFDPSKSYNDPHGYDCNSPLVASPKSPGQVIPIRITAPDTGTLTKGPGRFPIIDQFLLIFYLTQAPQPRSGVFDYTIRCALVPSLFHPMQGQMPVLDRFKVEGKVATNGSSSFQLIPDVPLTGGGDLRFFRDGTTAVLWANKNARHGALSGRYWGANHASDPLTNTKKIDSSNPEEKYTFISNTVTVSGNITAASKWTFKGGKFDVRVLTTANEEVQKYSINFPDIRDLPFPQEFKLVNGDTVYPEITDGYITSRFFRNIYADKSPRVDYDSIIFGGDVARSIQLAPDVFSNGDQRLLACTRDIPETWFSGHKYYSDGSKRFAHNLRDGAGYAHTGTEDNGGGGGSFVNSLVLSSKNKRPWLRSEMGASNDILTTSGAPSDWDTGFGAEPDGAYMSKADEGCSPSSDQDPYFFTGDWNTAPNGTLTAPNRLAPSAGIFGSLPTGVKRLKPWQTLLFRPDPSSRHEGGTSPKDHLLLDLFQMPIVEPYAISEPFSTAGKINLNYQIIPFTYIKRDTGLRAVLKNERLISIPDSVANSYKNDKSIIPSIRLRINLDETLKSWENRFASGDIFRSASEICDLPLVPVGKTLSDMASFWSTNRLTGDNLRERPYTTIYPRLTTKSNVFTVHYRVQLLKKSKLRISNNPTSFNTALGDSIAGEYRGSTVIERYIDPNDPRLPDFATDLTANAESFYRFRVLDSRQFNP